MMVVDRARLAAALPGYELGDQLGAGGFGLVPAGWHRGLQRDVAVKVLHAGHGRVRRRGADPRQPGSSARGPSLRLRQDGRSAPARHGDARRGNPDPAPGRHGPTDGLRGGTRGGLGPGLHPRQRGAAPRHQARQYSFRHYRPAESRRLRGREIRRRVGGHRECGDRNTAVYGPRTDHGRPLGAGHRPVRPRDGALPATGRRGTVRPGPARACPAPAPPRTRPPTAGRGARAAGGGGPVDAGQEPGGPSTVRARLRVPTRRSCRWRVRPGLDRPVGYPAAARRRHPHRHRAAARVRPAGATAVSHRRVLGAIGAFHVIGVFRGIGAFGGWHTTGQGGRREHRRPAAPRVVASSARRAAAPPSPSPSWGCCSLSPAPS